jgi:hypothetical protein
MTMTDGTALATVDQAGQLLTAAFIAGKRLQVGGAG